MPLEYITLFMELLGLTKKITINSISSEVKQKLSPVTDGILSDISQILEQCLESNYILPETKKQKILERLDTHEGTLSRTIEQYTLLKVCSKCGKTYPATHKYFHKDHQAKDGLRRDCRQCHLTAKKEAYYQKKKNVEEINGTSSIGNEYGDIIQD